MKSINNNNTRAENPSAMQGRENCRSINEVAEMFGLNIWTIRLWANRFDILKPCRNVKGDILFASADVDRIGTICRLTKKKGITFDDIRKRLEAHE